MMTTANRWIMAVGWMTAMALVWAVFVPNPMSNIVFTLIAAGGLLVMLCGAALLNDSQAPRSVTAIIADLEAELGERGHRRARPSAER